MSNGFKILFFSSVLFLIGCEGFRANAPLSLPQFPPAVIDPSVNIYQAPTPVCSSKMNLDFGPTNSPLGNPNQYYLNQLTLTTLCDGLTWVGTIGPETNANGIDITNFQYSNVGVQAIVDITAQGVSTPTSMGGLDPSDTLQHYTDYCAWLVSDGTLAGTGLVWSSRCDNNGPDGTVQQSHPYYAYIGWNRTNGNCPGSGCGFLFSIEKSGDWSYFAGGTGSGSSGTGQLPNIYLGAQAQWTQLNPYPGWAPPDADAVIYSIVNWTAGTHAAIGADTSFGNNFICDNTGYSGDIITCGPVASDRGYMGYYSNSPTAVLRILGFHDPM